MADWLASIGPVLRAHPVATRWILAGPGALVAALVTMSAMPVWLPAGQAGIDHIAYPLVLAPLIWAAMFTYACIEENLSRGAAVIVGAIVGQGAMIAASFAVGA